jgi:putative FmdB family regulatory protein
MPLYEYVCTCGHTQEEPRKMEDRDAETPCPQCGRKMTRRQGRVAVRFNGTGWTSPSSGEK